MLEAGTGDELRRASNPKMGSGCQLARPSLDGQRFGVVVIGGGINGVAIARECVRAGRRTLLLEQNDFASGTTSRSTRIIHGGLRYLEHGELGLVREALRERQALLRDRPHLVRRMSFLLPLEPGSRHSALAIRAGLWLYGAFAHSRPAPAAAEAAKLERLLDAGKSWSIFHYEDAQCEFPERLVAEWLVEARLDGLEARNHSAVLEIERRDRAVHAVIVRDRLTNDEYRVQADAVVNAAGPWADRVAAGIHRDRPMVGGVRGSHIVLPRFEGVPKAAVYSEAADSRPVFIIPWNGQMLVGTTEIRDNGDPSHAQPSEEEIEYLLASLRRLLPGRIFRHSDVVYAFAGVRPLPFTPGQEPSAISRRCVIVDHADDGATGLWSIIGGKLTTAAALAREMARMLGMVTPEAGEVDLPCPRADGIESALTHWSRQVAKRSHLSEVSARAIAEWHGRRALAIARLAASDIALREPICPHSDHIAAEAVEAVRCECAVTLADILLRRVPVALSGCWSGECSRHAARAVGAVLHWDERQIAREMENFEEERSRFLTRVPAVAEKAA